MCWLWKTFHEDESVCCQSHAAVLPDNDRSSAVSLPRYTRCLFLKTNPVVGDVSLGSDLGTNAYKRLLFGCPRHWKSITFGDNVKII